MSINQSEMDSLIDDMKIHHSFIGPIHAAFVARVGMPPRAMAKS